MTTANEKYDEDSIIAGLLKFDEIIKNFYQEMRQYQNDANQCQIYSEEVDKQIEESISEIRTEMFNRLKSMYDYIDENKSHGFGDIQQYQFEIDSLNKENEDLSNQIAALKVQINKMEKIIGKNENKFSYTK